MRFQALFEKKNRTWLYIALGVVGVVILFFLISSQGSGSATQVVQSGPSEALQAENLRAQTALQQAQIQSGAQLQALQFEGALAGQVAALEADTRLQLARMQQESEFAAIEGTLAGMNLQLGYQSQVDMASIEANRAVQLATIGTQEMIAQIQAESAMFQSQLASETMVAQAAMNTQLMLGLERERSDVELGRIRADVERERIGSSAAVQAAQAQASAQKRASSNNLIGGIIGGVLGLFSDVRVKENIKYEGERPDGLGLYSYNYKGSSRRVSGVMAQEVAMQYPDSVFTIDAMQGVDYWRLPA